MFARDASDASLSRSRARPRRSRTRWVHSPPPPLTRQYNVPLFINDRIDVFLAVKPAGLHIGQSDLPLARARELVGEDALIGVSVSNVEEARAAVAGGADYVGVGAIWDTGSKDVTAKLKLAPEGAGVVLDVLEGVPSVAIGKWQNDKGSGSRLANPRAQAVSTRPTSRSCCTAP